MIIKRKKLSLSVMLIEMPEDRKQVYLLSKQQYTFALERIYRKWGTFADALTLEVDFL